MSVVKNIKGGERWIGTETFDGGENEIMKHSNGVLHSVAEPCLFLFLGWKGWQVTGYRSYAKPTPLDVFFFFFDNKRVCHSTIPRPIGKLESIIVYMKRLHRRSNES